MRRGIVHRAGDLGGRTLQSLPVGIESTGSAPAMGRIRLPYQCDNGRQTGDASHRRVFRVDPIYRSHDKSRGPVIPAAVIGPQL